MLSAKTARQRIGLERLLYVVGQMPRHAELIARLVFGAGGDMLRSLDQASDFEGGWRLCPAGKLTATV
jgi:hypothetical protein